MTDRPGNTHSNHHPAPGSQRFHDLDEDAQRRYSLDALARINDEAVEYLITLQRFSTDSSNITNFTAVSTAIPETTDPHYAETTTVHESLAVFEPDKAQEVLDELAHETNHGLDAKRTSDAYGGPQMWIDVAMNAFLTNKITEAIPGAVVVGEESQDCEWGQLRLLLPGDLVVLIDPLDGSTPFQVTGSNYSVVAVLCREVTSTHPSDDGHLEVIGATLADSSQCVYILDLIDQTVILRRYSRTGTHERSLTDPDTTLAPANPWTIATVALSPTGRRRIAPLLRTTRGWGMPPQQHGGTSREDPAASVITLGGNPLACQMATGGLGFLVFADWSTVFDAIGLLLLAVQPDKFHFTRLDTGAPIAAADLIDLFHDVHRPPPPGQRTQGTGTYKPIPPVLAARKGGLVHRNPGEISLKPDETVADRLISALLWSAKYTPHVE